MSPQRPHFLVLTFPLQGHIAPALRLARRLLAVAPDVLVTFSTTEDVHGRMFPTKPMEHGGDNNAEEDDGRLEFLPFSDGTEAGDDARSLDSKIASFHAAGARGVAEIMDALAAQAGRALPRTRWASPRREPA